MTESLWTKSLHITYSASLRVATFIFFSKWQMFFNHLKENTMVALKFVSNYYMLITLHYLGLPGLSTDSKSCKTKHTDMIKRVTKYGFYLPRLNIY